MLRSGDAVRSPGSQHTKTHGLLSSHAAWPSGKTCSALDPIVTLPCAKPCVLPLCATGGFCRDCLELYYPCLPDPQDDPCCSGGCIADSYFGIGHACKWGFNTATLKLCSSVQWQLADSHVTNLWHSPLGKVVVGSTRLPCMAGTCCRTQGAAPMLGR